MRAAADRAHRWGAQLVVAAALGAGAGGLTSASARAAEPPRWQLQPQACALYTVVRREAAGAGQQLEGLQPGWRTLFGAELAGGRRLATPPGQLGEVAWQQVVALPERLDARGRWAVAERYEALPPAHGPLLVQGQGRAARSGPIWQLEKRLVLRAGPPLGASVPSTQPRLREGTLLVRAQFDGERGLLLAAEAELGWSDSRGEQHRVACAFALERLLAEQRPALEQQAAEAVARALAGVLRPYLEQRGYSRNQDQQLGHLALVLYAALMAGLEPAAPLARSALAEIERLPWEETYSVALAILALEASGLERGAAGPGSTRPRVRKHPLPPRARALLAQLAAWLVRARLPGRGQWSYRPPQAEGAVPPHGDNSNTQFAVLALHAARRSGVAVPPELWREVAEHFLRAQQSQGPEVALELELEPGASARSRALLGLEPAAPSTPQPRPPAQARGAGYRTRPGGEVYASMTAACVSSLLIAARWLDREGGAPPSLLQRLGPAIRDGLAWLQLHHCMRYNWPHHGWPYYHLYSLEKAFELAEVRRIRGHDWWAEGARELLLRQGQDGSWGSVTDTALAVLFLTRATAEPELEITAVGPALTGGAAGSQGEQPVGDDAVALEGLGVVRARQVIEALEAAEPGLRRERIALAERVFAAMEPERRPLLVPALARALESRYPEVRRLAAELLERTVGERVREPEAALAFFRAWQQVQALQQQGGEQAIAALAERLQAEQPPGLRCAAALALARLDGAEAIPALIEELERAPTLEHRRLIHQVLVSLTARNPGYDPEAPPAARRAGLAAWRALWAEHGAALLAAARARRAARAGEPPAER